jgi:tetratricopeptide (TPR) repeat protein
MNKQEIIAQLEEARKMLAESAKAIDTVGDPFALTLQARTLVRVIELDPGNWAPHYQLGRLYAKLNQAQDSMQAYNAAVLHDVRLGGEEKIAEAVYRLLGGAWEQAGDAAQALIQYGRFLGSYPLSMEAAPVLQRINTLTKSPPDWFQLFQEGARAQRLKDHAKACEKLNLCVRRQPGFAPAWFRLGISYRAQQDNRAAIDSYVNALRYDPHPRYYVELGSAYEAGKNPVAADCYRTALQVNPDEALAHAQLGLLLFAGGQRDVAYGHLERAVRIAPEGPLAERCWEALSTLTHAHGHSAAPASGVSSVSYADENVRWQHWEKPQDGLNVQYPHWARVVEPRQGELVRFVDRENGKTSISLRWIPVSGTMPQNIVRKAQAQLIRTRQTIFDGVAMINVRGEQVDVVEVADKAKTEAMFLAMLQRGQHELLELKATAPVELYPRLRHAFLHMVKSWQVMSAEDLQAQQMQQLEAAVKAAPNDPFAIAAWADKLTEVGQYDAAGQTYQKLLKLQPKFTNGHVGLALCCWKQGRTDLAMKHLENAVAIRAEPRSLSLLVTLYENEDQIDRGAKVLRKALSQDPNNAELRAFMGNYYFDRRDLKNAENELLAAHKLDPQEWQTCHQLGALYSQLKRPLEALPYLRKARDLQPRPDADTLLLLGLCELQCQHIDLAEKALQDVLAVDFSNETALEALTAIAEAREKAISGKK